MDRFEELLQELGNVINVPLHPDKHRVCKLNINNVLDVQIEIDTRKERIFFVCLICDVPPGKFRENLLKEALKANDEFPRIGTLGFAERHNKLTLHEFLHLPTLNGEKMSKFLFPFIEKADEWRRNVDRGAIPAISKKPPPPGMKL